ncbi:MAG: AraC family ligand binding domain-containing protein [Oscillospiraceae bacterium]|nr:AraC family ligand binding domain-containing protein [Oscillospiraceae bacterium]
MIFTKNTFEEACLNWFTDDVDFPFFIQYGGHDRDLYIHSHRDFNELVIVIDGSAIHIVNNEEYPVKKGDVFVIGNSTVHGYKNPNNFRICNIMYRHNAMFAGLPDISSSAGFQALFVLEPCLAKDQSFKNRLSLKREDYRTVKMLIDKMLGEYENNSECKESFLTSLFIQLAVTLSRIYSFDNSEKEQDIINIAKAVSYIGNIKTLLSTLPVKSEPQTESHNNRHHNSHETSAVPNPVSENTSKN